MQLQGSTPRSPTDAELVLGAYRLWGEDSPKHLLGDFAYAVWDERLQRMFCARDHMGARPFYYVCNESIFAFASEDEALLGLPGVSNLPNEELIAQLLVPAFNDFDTQPAWLKDVSALMPAQSLVMDGKGAPRITTYWRLEPGEEQAYASDQACQDAFLAVFGEAVRCRLRSAGPVAKSYVSCAIGKMTA
jgi:asparagine synthase (glutamine-hydrolysing)